MGARKGAIRLATVMKAPTAMDAAAVFTDVFDEVLLQVAQGQKRIRVLNPSRIASDEEHIDQIRKLWKRIIKAVDDLLNTVVDPEQKTTVKDELTDVALGAVEHIKGWLRSRKIGNEKIEAETCLLLEQACDLYERRQSDLATAAVDRENKHHANFEKKITIVEKLMEMYDRLEPNAVIDLMGQFIEHPIPLSSSRDKLLPNKTDSGGGKKPSLICNIMTSHARKPRTFHRAIYRMKNSQPFGQGGIRLQFLISRLHSKRSGEPRHGKPISDL